MQHLHLNTNPRLKNPQSIETPGKIHNTGGRKMISQCICKTTVTLGRSCQSAMLRRCRIYIAVVAEWTTRSLHVRFRPTRHHASHARLIQILYHVHIYNSAAMTSHQKLWLEHKQHRMSRPAISVTEARDEVPYGVKRSHEVFPTVELRC